MRRGDRGAWRAMLVPALIALAAGEASAFDCAKAKTGVEKAICADPALKRLDDALATAYGAVKAAALPEEQKQLAQSQRRWIARREYCSNVEDGIGTCVAEETARRLSLLSGRPESGPGAPGRLVPVFRVQDGTPAQWDIDIAVLRFADAKTPGEMLFNAEVDRVLADAKLGPHGEDTQGMTYARQDEFSLTYASPRLLSVRTEFYVNEGGAHGMYGTSNINIDMMEGRILTAQDLLPEPSAAILTLWCKQQVDAERQKRVPDAGDVPYDEATRDKTIAETVRNLASWSIGEKEIVVSFNPYDIGAYAEGSYSCSFPTAGVRELAAPGNPLP